MYIIEYYKTDGDVITLTVESEVIVQDVLNSLTNRMIDGYILSFNIEVLS